MIFLVGKPEKYLWTFPGFPSLVVSYMQGNSFFSSASIGIAVISMLEFKRNGHQVWFYFSVFALFYLVLVLIALRANYIIDLLFGGFFAHYCFIIADRYVGTKFEEENKVKRSEDKESSREFPKKVN